MANDRVPVVGLGGEISNVPAEQLDAAIEQGYQPASPEQVAKFEAEQKYGGVGGAALATGAGLARGLTLGASDYLGEKLGYQEQLRGLQTANPGLSLTGELAGAALPAFLSGGSSAAAGGLRGALGTAARFTPSGLVEAAGVSTAARAAQLAEGISGATKLGAATKALVPSVARGLVEGAAFGAGSGVSEASLTEDPEDLAERALAGGLHGALFGASLGAAAEGLMSGLSAGKQKLSELIAPKLEANKLADTAGEIAVKSLKLNPSDAVKLRGAGGAEGAGRRMLEDGIDPTLDIASKAEAIAKKRSDYSDKIGSLLDQADVATGKAYVSKAEVMKSIDELTAEFAKMPEFHERELAGLRRVRDTLEDVSQQRAALSRKGLKEPVPPPELKSVEPIKPEMPREVNPYAWDRYERELGEFEALKAQHEAYKVESAEFAKKAAESADRLSFGDVKSISNELSQMSKKADAGLKPLYGVREAFEKARHRLEAAIRTAGDTAAKEGKLSKTWVKEYVDAKLGLKQYSILDNVAQRVFANEERQVPAYLRNAGFGAVLGAAAGGLNPVNALIGAAVGSGRRILVDEGPGMVAKGLYELSKSDWLARYAQRTDEALVKALNSATSKAEAGASVPVLDQQKFEEIVNGIQRVAADPVSHSTAVTEKLKEGGILGPEMSETLSAIAMKNAQAASFIASKVPQAPVAPNPFKGPVKPVATEFQRAKFARYVKASLDPMSVVDDLRRGNVSSEAVEAVRELYPRLYQQLQAVVFHHVSDEVGAKGARLSYQKRMALGKLFGFDLEPSAQKAFVTSLQQAHAPEQPRQGGGGGMKAGNIAANVQSQSDRLESR